MQISADENTSFKHDYSDNEEYEDDGRLLLV